RWPGGRDVPRGGANRWPGRLPGGAGHRLDGAVLQRPDACTRCMGQHARRPGAFGDRHGTGRDRGGAWFLDAARRRKAMRMSLRLPAIGLMTAALVACNVAPQPVERQYGAEPDLPQPHRGLLPNMTISTPADWGDRLPEAPAGFTVRAIATDLGI